MRQAPAPGGFDDVVEFAVARVPAQVAHDLVGACDQDVRVAGASRRGFGRNPLFGYLARHLYHLGHRIAAAVAEVVYLAAFFHRVQGQRVRVSQVDDVNVVAHTCAVGSVVIFAEDVDVARSGGRDAQRVRDQVCFGGVGFAEALARAGGIEASQADVTQPVSLVVPAQHSFKRELRFSERIDRIRRRLFGDWRRFGRAVNGRARREDKFLHARGQYRVEQRYAGAGVVGKVEMWVFDRFVDQARRGHMDYGLDPGSVQRADERVAIR